MKPRFTLFLEKLRTGYWFVPSVMTLAAIAASVITLRVDSTISFRWAQRISFVWTGGVDGAREVLSTIAGSMITVAGVVFSITIVALALASQQFGPRLLRNFMRDIGNQVVLGTFIATFVYCLLVLREVKDVNGSTFIPYTSVTTGILLAILSLGVLIYYIHHVSDSIQVENLIAEVYEDLRLAIDEMYPDEMGKPEDEMSLAEQQQPPALPTEPGQTVCAGESGYIQSIDSDLLFNTAVKNNLMLHLLFAPGSFVLRGTVLAEVWPAEGTAPEGALEEVRLSFIIGNFRTPAQDIEFPINQMVEISLRALSPGINDPFTAITCIDWLGAAIARLARRRLPSPYRYDEENRLRVIAYPFTIAEISNKVFSRIRQYGGSSVSVMIHLLDTISKIAPLLYYPNDKQALQQHAELILHDSRQHFQNTADMERIEKFYHFTMQQFQLNNK